MYLIPKNIKIKKEVFKGFGFIELIFMALSIGIGFILQELTTDFYTKIILFLLFPLITFFLLLPLPNGSTALIILKKFFKFQYNQKNYKFK